MSFKKITKELIKIDELKKRDYIKFNFGYRFKCEYLNCPCNSFGLCKTIYHKFPFHLIHSYDGKNIIKCLCG